MYSEFVIALAMVMVWEVDDELIHTLPFCPTVHSKGKYFPRHFKRTNSLLRSLKRGIWQMKINTKHQYKFFFITGDHFVTFHNLYGLSRGVVRRRAHGSRRNLAYPVVPCMSPIQSQLITRNVFWISLQPDWQVNYDIFNRPIMVCIKFLVHKWGARKKDFSAVLQTDLTRPQLFERWVVLSTG